MKLAQEFLKPTQIYTTNLLPLIHKGSIKAISHVSNGGLLKNIAKIIPDNFVANINAKNWKIPDVYGWLFSCNVGLSISNLLEIFNCGIGMCFIVSMDDKKWKNISGAVKIGIIFIFNTFIHSHTYLLFRVINGQRNSTKDLCANKINIVIISNREGPI